MSHPDAGDYSLDVTYAPQGNYAGSTASSNLHVQPADQTINFGALSSRTYGDGDFALCASSSSSLPVTFTAAGNATIYQSAGTWYAHITGAGSAIITAHQAGNNDYNAAPNVSQTFNIAQAALTVTVDADPSTAAQDAFSRVYGAADPTFTVRYSGFVNGEDSSALGGLLSFNTNETQASHVGAYTISASGLTSANYDISYVSDTLNVTPAPLMVTANTETKVYGQVDPTLGYNVSGLEAGDTASAALTGSLIRDAGENVGSYAISQGSLAADSDYTLSFTGSNLTITPATLTVTAQAQSKVYGQADPTLGYSVNGLLFSDTGSQVLSGMLTRAAGETVGSYAISQGTLAANANYIISFISANLAITQATPTVSVSDAGGTYNAQAFAATPAVMGVSGTSGSSLEGIVLALDYEQLDGNGNVIADLGASAPVNAGSYRVIASFAGSTDYTSASSAPVPFTISKADASISVTPYSVIYDSSAHTAAGAVTGVGGVSLSGLDLSGTTHLNAGTTTDGWTFTDVTGNYNNASGTVSDGIFKANATVTQTNYSGTYDAQAHIASVVISGVGSDGVLAQNYDIETNAGSNLVSASIFGLQNYNDFIGNASIVIGQALATVAVSNYSETYDAQGHTASVQVIGVGGESASNSLTETNAGSYSVSAALSDPYNYSNASGGTASIDIAKANATVTPTNYSGTYNAQAHTASVVISGVGGDGILAQNSLTETNAGSYSVSAGISGRQNYNDASGTATIAIAKADATINVGGYSITYDGNAHTATGSVTGVQGETLAGLDLSGTTHTNAGTTTDSWTFTDSTGNYKNAAGSVSDNIAKATPTVSVTDAGGVYNGNPFPATATVAGVSGTPGSSLENTTPTLTYYQGTYTLADLPGSGGGTTAPSAAGNYTVVAAFAGSTDYIASSALTNFTIVDKFGAYQPPVSLNMSMVEGRTVPIKFQLTDANGNAVSSTSGLTLSISGPNGYSLLITRSNGLVYSSGQFQYNWQTPKVAGNYVLSISSNGVLVPGSAKTLDIVAPGSSAAGLETGSSAGTSTAGTLLGGEVDLYVDNSNGDLTSDELARIQDAVNVVQTTVAPYGVTIAEVTDPTQSNVTLNMEATTSLGGYPDGVLGCTTNRSQVTMVQGWNWYAGSDASGIGSNQFDFETAVIHELGHTLGLGHSSDSTSVMYATLGAGTANRTLVTADLNVPDDDSGPCALHAVPTAAMSSPSNGQGMAAPSSMSIPSSNGPLSAAEQVLANLTHLLNDARNAYQTELSSVAAMWHTADALALQRLDELLSLDAGAMGITKEILMRDLLFASVFSSNGV